MGKWLKKAIFEVKSLFHYGFACPFYNPGIMPGDNDPRPKAKVIKFPPPPEQESE